MVVDKADYLDKMVNLLNDITKFEKINLKSDVILNFAISQEKRVDSILKKIVSSNSISEETRRSVKGYLRYKIIFCHKVVLDV